MSTDLGPTATAPDLRPLLVDARTTARLLGISERTVASMTSENTIPHIRLRGRVLYPVRGLEQWVAENQRGPRPIVAPAFQQPVGCLQNMK